ncbi:unnamed protein product [Durusdinium trenchii]|uniref:Uncharacterized protein n=1 Tax=Durusdinium trenchii TaxID=1381693 RepID=A0ABP0T0F3_9DINO
METICEVNKARRIKKDIGCLKHKFSPPTGIKNCRIKSRTIYSKVGFISESELQHYTECTGKALKLTPVQLPLEDRPETLTGYVISLKDLPPELKDTIRKIKTAYEVNVTQEERRLDPENQIKEDQGSILFDFFADLQTRSAADMAKTINRSKVPTLTGLKEKAEKIRAVARLC